MAAIALAQAVEPGNDAVSHVYVIGPDGGPFKIGVANDVDIRLRQIQVSQAEPLHIKYRQPVLASSRYVVEKHAHALLSSHRLKGEWFGVPALAAIDAVVKAANDVGGGTLMPAPTLNDRNGRGQRAKRTRDGLGSLIQCGSLSTAQARAGQIYRRLFDEALKTSLPDTHQTAGDRQTYVTALNLVKRVDATVRAQVSPRAATLLLEVVGKGNTFSQVAGTSVQRVRQRNELVAALDVVHAILTPGGS